MNQYTTAGLSRLYQAVKEQAETEFLEALRQGRPNMTHEEETRLLNYYRNLESRAEAQMRAEYEQSQSRGNER